MIVTLFKLEDVGPVLSLMSSDQNVMIEQSVMDKFQFAGSITYSLVFQGSISMDDLTSGLYGPIPFAFSSGFSQYAFSLLVDDETMKDSRMKSKTLCLLIMLVPEMITKIDNFRIELEKVLFYRFRDVRHVKEIKESLLNQIIVDYNRIVTNLMNEQQANYLSNQMVSILHSLSNGSKVSSQDKICIIFEEDYQDHIRNLYANLLSSLPYTETWYKNDEVFINTPTHIFSINKYSSCTSDIVNTQESLIFVVDVDKGFIQPVYDILQSLKKNSKIALVIALCDDPEKASKQYANFFVKLQEYVGDRPFFSANFSTVHEFKSKMLEALFWALSPIE